MTPDTISPPEGESVTTLVSGIIQDGQELFKQQFALIRAELKADLQRSVRATALLTTGVLTLVPAIFLLGNMVSHLLHEKAGLSLWASHGIVGGAFALFGAVLVFLGIQRFRSINIMPDQSVEEIKENVRWMTNPK